jgi:hypothetical protein
VGHFEILTSFPDHDEGRSTRRQACYSFEEVKLSWSTDGPDLPRFQKPLRGKQALQAAHCPFSAGLGMECFGLTAQTMDHVHLIVIAEAVGDV